MKTMMTCELGVDVDGCSEGSEDNEGDGGGSQGN